MRLRTKMVGATTLALLGLLIAVQQWAQSPLLPTHYAPMPARAERRPPPPAEASAPAPRPVPPPAGQRAPRVEPAGVASPAPAALASSLPAPEETTRLAVHALVLAAARELAARPPQEPPEPAPARDAMQEAEREAAQLQRVPLEAGLPRVEASALNPPEGRSEPIDLRTGAGLEASQPLPGHDAVTAREPPEPEVQEPLQAE